MKWLIGLLIVLAALGGLFWYAVIDTSSSAQADSAIDLAAYRALVANDAAAELPTAVRVEEIGSSTAPSFAADAGAFDGERTFSYVAFQVVAPDGDTIIDAGLDHQTLDEMTDGKGTFRADVYGRVLDAMTRARRILITHEHLDHVMAITRHPDAAAIAPRLALTQAQLDGLPEHAEGGALAPEIAAVTPVNFTTPQRTAPGVVVAATPGHSPGSVVIYVRGVEREYLFIGDIVWQMSALERGTGRPRFIHWMMSGVDPDRPAVLSQVRELQEIAAENPDLVILPAHDDAYLRQRIAEGVVTQGFTAPAQASIPEATN